MSQPPVDLAMVAGEASGDLLASLVLKGVLQRWPHWRAAGIGGSAMAEAGFEAWWPSESIAVRGYVEVLRHYRRIVAMRDQLRQRLLAQPPRLFMGVDAPDFNLDLAHDLHRAGVPTLQLVAPAIWAWRPERIDKIRRSVDRVLCLFPFEPPLFESQGVPATFVGHPLAQWIPDVPDREAARRALGLAPAGAVVALLPGSRRAEVQHLLPRFLQAARQMQKAQPGLSCVMPVVPSQWALTQRILHDSGMADRVHCVRGQSHAVLAACDVTLIASGTATLEAALFKRPMVIAYHMNPLSWWLTQRKRLQPWVGLPNILAGECLVPEFLQDDAQPSALAAATLDWLQADALRLQQVQARFGAIHRSLKADTPLVVSHVIEAHLAS